MRDLGGLPTVGGPPTRWLRVVRSDTTDRLTAAGWEALRRHGVRTVVDLRDPTELDPGARPPEDVELVRVPVLDLDDTAFWGQGRWRGAFHSAPYYLAVLERWPERFAEAVRAVAGARRGGVLVQCQAGRDRTGLLVAALLRLVGVEPEAIVADYALSAPSLQPLYDRWLAEAADEASRTRIREANRSDAAALRAVLAGVDLAELLLRQGLATEDVRRLQERLLGRRSAASDAGPARLR